MIFAVSVFAILLSLLLGFNSTNDGKRLKFVKIMTFILIMISGLRHFAVGNDTYSYIREFQDYALYPFSDILSNFIDFYLHPGTDGNGKDPGFALFCKILTLISTDALFFEFFVAAFLLIPLSMFLYKNISSVKGLALAYIYYVTSYYIYLPNSSARQSLALAILLIGYLNLSKTKGLLGFCVSCIVSSFFHKSSLIAIGILPIYYFLNNKTLYRGSLFAFALMIVYYRPVGMFLSSLSDIYSVYGSSTFYESSSKPYVFLVFSLFIFFLAYMLMEANNFENVKRLPFIGLAVSFVLSPISLVDPSLMRVLSYFGVWTCIALDELTTNYPLIQKTRINMYYLLLFVFLLRAYMNPGVYAFIWDTDALQIIYK